MKLDRRLAKNLLLFFTPVVTSLSVAAAPSLAATFALSEASVTIDYRPNPENGGVSVDSDTFTTGDKSSVVATADSDAIFFTDIAFSNNYSISEAFGLGRDYWGRGESQAEVFGNFVIAAGQSFSFDFTANLNLQTSIDRPEYEEAGATGSVAFFLKDSKTSKIVDAFGIFGKLITPLDDDFVNLIPSEYLTVNQEQSIMDFSFGGNQESVYSVINGSYSRTFEEETHLTLIEVKKNQAIVKAPEPSSTLALIFFGLIGMGLKAATKRFSFRATQPIVPQ